ncbi:MAG: hydroxymethylbilane synthase [Archaeoglobaceae archaeon]|nr:hydroxymethylbilane synthase [Archaeoglobaceae archaeon]MCX8152084.1 hydroxymethylbilane synthase [Archaeoglobaceae archaeon]MDW8013519.1 hydroxymethylbilane synthase [Archaeoglobaceae archaeon]
MKLVVGSRGSKLALAQTKRVLEKLRSEGYEVELKIIKTEGDLMKDKPLHEFKGKGAFVRAIDLALARKEIDVAVHSYKDVPSQRIEGTTVAAVLERDSPCDALVSEHKLEDLPSRAKVGTSSIRRIAQFSRLRRDLLFENLRGNLDTRIRKLKEGLYDAIIVAEAGILRLGLNVKYQRFSPDLIVPAANQGIIAVATRVGEEELVSFMNDEKTFLEASVERAVLKVLGIGCAVPAGIYAEVRGKVRLICEILGEKYLRVEEDLCRESAVEEALEVARNIRAELWGKYT